jgi:hypothetical protein
MTEYLESFAQRNDVHYMDSFIVISRSGDNDFASAEIEYDSWDGRLFIDRNFLDTFINWFGGNEDYSQSFIAKWFEKKYDVEVKYTQS